MPRVAVFTFGILVEDHDHPRVQGFVDRNPGTFAAAERAAGFIARSGYDDEPEGPESWGPHAYPRFFTGDRATGTPATLSLWRDLESVVAFAYGGVHAQALARRGEWFVAPRWPTYVAWWADDHRLPSWAEAAHRREHLHDHGPSAFAFDFRAPHGPGGEPTVIDRNRAATLRARR